MPTVRAGHRPEYQHAWAGKTSYSQMRLDALPAESAAELLEALLGEDPGLAPLKQLLVKRGNPFFLEETVRTLVETKALAGERGRLRGSDSRRRNTSPPRQRCTATSTCTSGWSGRQGS